MTERCETNMQRVKKETDENKERNTYGYIDKWTDRQKIKDNSKYDHKAG